MSAIGADLSLRRRGPVFSPAALFAGGRAGGLYDASPGHAWQDPAGTLPAVAGDAVGRIDDLSGNGNHAVQPNEAARPMLRGAAGGAYYLEFDGADDFLRAPLPLQQPWERVSALRQLSWLAGRQLIGGVSANNGLLQQLVSTPSLRLFNGLNGVLLNVEAAVGADVVIGEAHDGAATGLRVGRGAAVVSDCGANPTAGVTFGASSANGAFGAMRLYASIMIDGRLSASEREALRGWMAARARIAG